MRASRQTKKQRDSETRPKRDTEKRQKEAKERWGQDMEQSLRDSEAEKLGDTNTHWEGRKETKAEKDRTHIQESKRIIIYFVMGNETLWRLAGKEKS